MPKVSSRATPQRSPGEPFGRALILLLSAIAGATDVFGLSILRDRYVSFMSGNTTQLGMAVGEGWAHRVGEIVPIVALFFVATTAGSIIAIRAGRRRLSVVVSVAGLILMLPVVLPVTMVFAMVAAMGVLNAAISEDGAVKVGLTYVTGTLVRTGQGLGRALCGGGFGWGWAMEVLPWLGILGGAILAKAGLVAFGAAAYAGLPAAMLAIAAATWLAGPHATPAAQT